MFKILNLQVNDITKSLWIIFCSLKSKLGTKNCTGHKNALGDVRKPSGPQNLNVFDEKPILQQQQQQQKEQTIFTV